MPSKATVTLFLASCISANVLITSAFHTGAPPAPVVCEEMLPQHGESPQKSPSPYNISLSSNKVKQGQTLSFTLTAPNDNPFKGFLAIVKKPGDTTKAYGQFKEPSDANIKTLGCFSSKNNAMTHADPHPKNKIVLEWIAPSNTDIQELELLVTFVRSFSEIWLAVKNPENIIVTN